VRNSSDPVRAFQARAKRNLRRIVKAQGQLCKSDDWRRISELLAVLEEIAHGLSGAGGVFGFSAVSETAAKLERQAERWRLDPNQILTSRRRAALAKSVGSLVAALRTIG